MNRIVRDEFFDPFREIDSHYGGDICNGKALPGDIFRSG
jgi:hypothetical protein